MKVGRLLRWDGRLGVGKVWLICEGVCRVDDGVY